MDISSHSLLTFRPSESNSAQDDLWTFCLRLKDFLPSKSSLNELRFTHAFAYREVVSSVSFTRGLFLASKVLGGCNITTNYIDRVAIHGNGFTGDDHQ